MHIKRNAVHGHKDRFGEMQVMKEFHEVGIMKSHGKQLYHYIPNSLPFIPPQFHHLQRSQQRKRQKETERLTWNEQIR
jgi:hypothetical protein